MNGWPRRHRVYAIVNYDNFYIAPDLMDQYTAAIRRIAREPLPRRNALHDELVHAPQLGDALTQRAVASYIHESRREATAWLDAH